LSRRTGIPVSTIKYYLREGLLPPGSRTSRNQAAYDDRHLDRIRLIATLRQEAGLTLDVIKRVFDSMDAMQGDSPQFMALAVDASLQLPARDRGPTPDAPVYDEAAALARLVLGRRGWSVDEHVPAWDAAVRACAAILSVGAIPLTERVLDRYAAVAEELAAFELPEHWNPAAAPADALRYVVLGTVLFEPLILALRRLAHINRGNALRAARSQPPSGHTLL
jgi:DNA-binding transcriptional MerR regulator